VDLENQEIETILELLIAADELLIQRLIDFIQEFLIKNTIENNMMCEDTKNENANILEETLRELIKLVRFHQIDRKEFVPEVWTYKHLLPDHLIEDIIRCYLDSDARPMHHAFLIRWGNFKIISELIDKEIALILTKWIDKKTVDEEISKGFKYHLNLIFKSSVDGLSSQNFHRNCDHKGATIVVAKIKNTNLLIGGYNPLDWSGADEWKQTTDSFLFVLDCKDIKGGVVSRVNNNHSCYAIYCDSDCGPSFGEGPDFHITNNSYTLKYKAKSYPKMVTSHTLTISEYEIFQVECIEKLSIQEG
ncbi:7462_t:CDS:2, partial [Racocetra fulgida]